MLRHFIEISDTIIIKNDTVPGMVLLFFDMAINYAEFARTYDSPHFYEIYSKKRNPNCVRISMMKNAQKRKFCLLYFINPLKLKSD